MADSSDESHLKRKMDDLRLSATADGASTSTSLVGPEPKRRCSNSEHSGHDPAGFSAEILESHLCCACKKIVKKAMSSDQCGHTYCAEFINLKRREGEDKFYCPHPECANANGGIVIDLNSVRQNKAVDNAIKKLPHHCPNRDRGCMMTPNFSRIEKHINEDCQYAYVPCSKCQMKVLRSEKDEHERTCTSEACPFRALGCEEINEIGPDGKSSPSQVPHHNGIHMALLIHHLRKEKEKRIVRPKDIREKLDAAEQHIETINDMVDMIRDPTKVSQLNSTVAEVKAELETLYHTCRDQTAKITDVLVYHMPELAEKKFRQERKMERLKYEETTKAKQQETLHTLMKELPLTMEVKEVIFKVYEFSKKRAITIREDNKRFYGPKFFADHHSYLLCPIIYPNGDGTGHERYVSVFIAVCKGPYDDLLEWPMNARISFTVLPQEGRSTEPIRHTFRTDPNSASYQRPEENMNPASGIPKTLLLTHLKQPSYFLKDDCLFVKISVDLLNKNHSNLNK